MAEEDRAALIWKWIESDLSDRGCFNGIDDDVMEELRAVQIETIRKFLKQP
jgi:hypothetical protein